MGFINSIHDTKTGCDSVIAGAMDIIICYDSADTINKVAIGPLGFSLDENKIYKIKFINGNTADNPTLNINGTGDIEIDDFRTDILSDNIYSLHYGRHSGLLSYKLYDDDIFTQTRNSIYFYKSLRMWCLTATGCLFSGGYTCMATDVCSITNYPMTYFIFCNPSLCDISKGLCIYRCSNQGGTLTKDGNGTFVSVVDYIKGNDTNNLNTTNYLCVGYSGNNYTFYLKHDDTVLIQGNCTCTDLLRACLTIGVFNCCGF